MKNPPTDLTLLTSQLEGRKILTDTTWITRSTYRTFLRQAAAADRRKSPSGILAALDALVSTDGHAGGCLPSPTGEHFIVRLPGFSDITASFPIDWAMDPHGDRGWRNGFQSLNFLSRMLQSENGIRVAVEVVASYAVHSNRFDSPLEFSSDEHAVASRLNNVAQLIFKIVGDKFLISNASFEAIVTILFSHMYMLSDSEHYPIRHNHGLMRDKALLTNSQHFAEMKDAQTLQLIAEYRMEYLQVKKSISPDFFHVENSPWYHLFFVRLLSDIVKSCYCDFGRTPPKYLLQVRNKCATTLLSMVQPNFQLAPFGDTLRWDVSSAIGRLIAISDSSVPFPPSLKKRLRYIATRGRYGVSHLPATFISPEAGYAVLRAEGLPEEDVREPLLIYIKGGRLSRVHSHADETSFQAFAFGQEALVDPGRYSNDRGLKETASSVSALGHNVLRPVSYTGLGPRAGKSRIMGSERLDAVSRIVTMKHSFFQALGVQEYRRFVIHSSHYALLVGDLIVVERSLQVREQLLLHSNFLPAGASGGLSHELAFCRADGRGMRIVGGNLVSQEGTSRPALTLGSNAFYPKERERQDTPQVCMEFEVEKGVYLYFYHVQFFRSADEPHFNFTADLLDNRIQISASRMEWNTKYDLPLKHRLLDV